MFATAWFRTMVLLNTIHLITSSEYQRKKDSESSVVPPGRKYTYNVSLCEARIYVKGLFTTVQSLYKIGLFFFLEK